METTIWRINDETSTTSTFRDIMSKVVDWAIASDEANTVGLKKEPYFIVLQYHKIKICILHINTYIIIYSFSTNS